MTSGSDSEPHKAQTERLGRYLLLKLLAAGGMAEIHLARHIGIEGFRKLLVIKRIHKHLALDQRFVEMFFDEARIAARLSHPNIAQIFDLGRVDGFPFIAMEYIEGVSLHDYLGKMAATATAPMAWPLVCFVAARACEGLAHAHALCDESGRPVDLVHRDISPHNLLLSYDGVIKVVDFGIARASIRIEQTQSYSRKGKLRYMSPEQALGLPLDRRSDLFSLGIVIWELLSNQRLFDGEGELGVLQQITAGSIPDPSVPGGMPPEVLTALRKALAREPDDRYPDAASMGEAFEAALMSAQRQPNSKQLAEHLQSRFAEEFAQTRAQTTQLLSLDVEALAEGADGGATGRRGPSVLTRWLAVGALALLFLAGGALGTRWWLANPVANAPETEPTALPTSAPSPVSITPPVVQPKAESAYLSIDGVPEGAALLVDGERLQVALPIVHLPVTPGSHRIRVEKPGHKAWEQRLEFKAAQEHRLVASLPTLGPVTGYLTFNTMPWAKVLLGERELGETPLVRLKLPVGRHSLTVLPLGKGPARVVVVEVQPGQLTLKTLNL